MPWYLGVLSFVFMIAYYTYLEGSRGQTIGKMITKEGFDLVTISRALNPWVNIFNLYSRFRTSPSSI